MIAVLYLTSRGMQCFTFAYSIIQVVKKNEGIYASNMSANRDESVFKDPDTFDIQCVFGKPGVTDFPVMHISQYPLSASV